MNRWILRLQWLIVVTLVFYGLFRSQPPEQLFSPWEDKYQHVAAFAGLMFSSLLLKGENILLATIPIIILAISAEIIQPLISSLRHGSWGDGVANIGGTWLGLVCFMLWKRYRKKR